MKEQPERLTAEGLKRIIQARGGRIVLLPDGTPVLRGLGKLATPELLRVVGHFREELIADLKGASDGESIGST